MRLVKLILAILTVVVLFGCSSEPETMPEAEAAPSGEKTEVPDSGAPQKTPADDPKQAQETQPEKFEASEELYKETFEDIEALIKELNEIIREGKYNVWLTYLTEDYIQKTSRPEYLRRWQKDPRLSERNITLHTLRDYFEYVVVPTRSRVKLDEIEFVDDHQVYAYTVFEGQKYLLYNLVKTDDGWKIDFY